jgi:hypothetical protein
LQTYRIVDWLFAGEISGTKRYFVISMSEITKKSEEQKVAEGEVESFHEMMVLMMIEDMLADLGCESVTAAATVDLSR